MSRAIARCHAWRKRWMRPRRVVVGWRGVVGSAASSRMTRSRSCWISVAACSMSDVEGGVESGVGAGEEVAVQAQEGLPAVQEGVVVEGAGDGAVFEVAGGDVEWDGGVAGRGAVGESNQM